MAEADPAFPPVLFTALADPAGAKAFADAYWPEARVVSDPDARLYRALAIPRGRLAQMFGPEVWACGVRAGKKGLGVGRPVGDPWQMPAFLVVEGGRVTWRYDPRHAGDHPDLAAIPARAPAG